MPTTIPMAHKRRQAALYADSNLPSRIATTTIRARDELLKTLRSEDFKNVAIFAAIGLVVSLIAAWSGVQGVWM